MPRGDQLARQWRLLESLGRPQGLPIEDAVRHLGCTVRTIWRDLHALQDAGFPIYDERDGRRGVWKVESGFRDRLPVPLSLSEIVALLVSHDLLDHGGAGPFGPSVASALAKLRALLTPRALVVTLRETSMRVDEKGTRKSLGTVAAEGKRLVFEATSRRRAENGRKLIEAIAGDAVAHRATTYEDVEQAMNRRRGQPPKALDFPPEVQAELTSDLYERHYRAWLDQPLPALGGRSPRQAAGVTSSRGKVVALLKVMENTSERQRREGQVAYDFGWMWAELGLDRPG